MINANNQTFLHKVLALAISLALVLSLFPMAAMAEEIVQDGGAIINSDNDSTESDTNELGEGSDSTTELVVAGNENEDDDNATEFATSGDEDENDDAIVVATASSSISVVAFAGLDPTVKIRNINRNDYPTVESLGLPGTLEATVASDEGDVSATIEGVTWQPDHAYNPSDELIRKYVFTAAMPEGYALLENVNLPKITVNVAGVVKAAATVSISDGDELRTAAASTGSGDILSIAINTVDINDVVSNANVLIERSLTIDLNGNQLSMSTSDNSANGIKLAAGVTLKIIDSNTSGNGNGKLIVINNANNPDPNYGAAINTSEGTLIIESGTVWANYDTDGNYNGSSFGAGIGGGRE